ncbi:MAG: hypothetical protein KAT62_00540 [Desulfuromonadales bacterium]|nr:hypothetical protein [Desulfuromonadales bacterium]
MRTPARAQKPRPEGCGQLAAVLAAQVQPCGIVLHAVIAAESGELDGEDDVYFSGADVAFQAVTLLEIFGFAPGC